MKITRTKLLAAALAALVSLGLFVPIGGAQPYYQQITGSVVSALTQFRAAAGSSSVPSYSFTADPDTGLKSSAANVVGVVVGGVERFTFGSAGFGLKGSSSGTLTLAAPAAAGTNTLTLPAGTTDFSATGGTSQVVKQTSSGGAFTVARLACADLSNATAACSTSLGTGVATALGNTTNASGGVVTFSGNIGAASATSVNFGGTTLSTYAEGTWTPVDASGASLAVTGTGTYVRIGNVVTAVAEFDYPATADGTQAKIGGLPFATTGVAQSRSGCVVSGTTSSAWKSTLIISQALTLRGASVSTVVTNADMSGATGYVACTYVMV